MIRVWLALLLSLAVLCAAAPSRAQTEDPTPVDAADAKKEQARVHFERGAALVRGQAWEAALAEFLLSRALYPTRGNTQNAAVCLRQLERYDEALDMLEALLASFPSLTPADRAAAEEDARQVRLLVGAIDVRAPIAGAQIQIDDVSRGAAPMERPVRVRAGAHRVRVYKEGFVTFVAHVDVAGGQTAVVQASLDPLRDSGRLQVSEQAGKIADVLVDGFPVGRTPWEGLLAAGEHMVSLRGEEGLGTQPAQVTLRAGGVTALTLDLEPLDAELAVEPVPVGALVALDGVPLGGGVWKGRVRSGGHRIEIAAPGFLPQTRSVLLATGQREKLVVVLERDPESPFGGAAARGRIVFDAHFGIATGPTFGGDVSSACGAGCSTGVPVGAQGMVHAGYELRGGFGFALDAGYLLTSEHTRGRPILATPRGRAPIAGTADDTLTLRGLTLGGSVAYHRARAIPFTLRLGAGVLLGETRDERTANLPLGSAGATETPAARYAYIAPEARIGYRAGEHLELTAGVQALVLVALTQPKWEDQDGVVLGRDFLSFGEQTVGSSLLLVVTPGIGLRYEL